MGEKETGTSEDVAARDASLNVSATPGGSDAGIVSAAVSSVGNEISIGDPPHGDSARLHSRPTGDVTIPLSSD